MSTNPENRCQCITQGGSQCKRTVKTGRYCYQHQDCTRSIGEASPHGVTSETFGSSQATPLLREMNRLGLIPPPTTSSTSTTSTTSNVTTSTSSTSTSSTSPTSTSSTSSTSSKRIIPPVRPMKVKNVPMMPTSQVKSPAKTSIPKIIPIPGVTGAQGSKIATKDLCRDLKPFVGKTYDLYALLCTQLNRELSYDDLLELLNKCPPISDCFPCTQIGAKIAQSLIKIAALRIFAEPEQSIVELLVNSLDAYYPEKKIGKFGMGFFSILYWLIGHPKRFLTIESFVHDDKGYCSYKIVIREIDDRLTFQIKSIDREYSFPHYLVGEEIYFGYPGIEPRRVPKRQIEGRTDIKIYAKDDPFSLSNVSNFYKQSEKIRYFFRTWAEKHKSELETPINFMISSERLSVEDFASGIPLEVLFGSLLVPSISTKSLNAELKQSIKNKEIQNFVNQSEVKLNNDNLQNTFSILVGGIVVVSLSVTSKLLYIDGDRRQYDPVFEYILDMPRVTTVPISRDDIILDKSTIPIFKQSLEILFDTAIGKYKNVYYLQELLGSYIDYTASSLNKEIVKEVIDQYTEKYKKAFIPRDYTDLYRFIGRTLQQRFVVSQFYSPWDIEQMLDLRLGKPNEWSTKNLTTNNDIWYATNAVILNIPKSMKVEFVSGDDWGGIQDISNGGLIRYLFIRQNYIEKIEGPNNSWIFTITTSYVKTQLVPFESDLGDDFFKEVDSDPELLERLNRSIQKLRSHPFLGNKVVAIELPKKKVSELITNEDIKYVWAVISKYSKTAKIYFNGYDKTNREYLICDLVICRLIYSAAQFQSIIGSFLSCLAKFKGNQNYGSERYKIVYSTQFFEYELFRSSYYPASLDPDRYLAWLNMNNVMSLGSCPERPQTILEITSNGASPCRLANKLNLPDFLMNAWNLSRNLGEYTMLFAGGGYTLYNSIINERLLGLANTENINFRSFVSYLLEGIRRRGYDDSDLPGTYLFFQTYTVNAYDAQTNVGIARFRTLADNWLRMIGKYGSVDIYTPRYLLGPDATTFKLTSLIDYLFVNGSTMNNNNMKDIDLNKLYKNVKHWEDEGKVRTNKKLQIVEIAINEGTTKPFIEATLTELVQNSLDAIRSEENSTIRIKVLRSKDYRTLYLSVRDTGGMDSNAFLSLTIPFLSTKTASELTAGEMGSGFFNVYRGSREVEIISHKNGITRIYRDRPIIVNDRVVDVEKTFEELETLDSDPKSATSSTSSNQIPVVSKGSDITLAIPVPDSNNESEQKDNFISLLSSIELYCRNVIGLANYHAIYFSTKEIGLGEYIMVDRKVYGEVGPFVLYLLQPDDGVDKDSYILTKGVPLTPLLPYLEDIVDKKYESIQERVRYNCLINIKHGGYTPVQTRTRINLPEEVREDWILVQRYIIFLSALDNASKGNVTLDHQNSSGDATQLKFTISTNSMSWRQPRDYLKYTTFMYKPCIAEQINRCIDVVDTDAWSKNTEEKIFNTLNGWSTTGYLHTDEQILQLIYDWFKKKNKMASKESEEQKANKKPTAALSRQSERFVAKQLGSLENFMNLWTKIYWEIAKKEGIQGAFQTQEAPPVIIIDTKDNTNKGEYHRDTHTIYINIAYMNPISIVQFVKTFENASKLTLSDIEKLDNNEAWSDYFGLHYPSTTMPHEIEHARRSDGGHSFHDSIRTVLYPGDAGETRSFDESTNAVYEKVLAGGFYDRLLTLLSEIDFTVWKEEVSILSRLAANYPQYLEQPKLSGSASISKVPAKSNPPKTSTKSTAKVTSKIEPALPRAQISQRLAKKIERIITPYSKPLSDLTWFDLLYLNNNENGENFSLIKIANLFYPNQKKLWDKLIQKDPLPIHELERLIVKIPDRNVMDEISQTLPELEEYARAMEAGGPQMLQFIDELKTVPLPESVRFSKKDKEEILKLHKAAKNRKLDLRDKVQIEK